MMNNNCEAICIEDICGSLTKLKKDHELTSKACLKAKKDKSSLSKLTEQHVDEIQKLKPYITQQIQNKLKLEQNIFDLQWLKQFKVQELSRAKSEIHDETSINEALIDTYEINLQTICNELLNFKLKIEESKISKVRLSEEIVRQGNIFSSLCEERKTRVVEVRRLSSETNQLHAALDLLEETHSFLLKENVNRISQPTHQSKSSDVEKMLIIEQQKCSDQLKHLNNDIRELRQKKQAIAQQIDSKRKLKEAMNEELKNLAKELNSKSVGSMRNGRVENSGLTSPFASHFSGPKPPSSSSAQKFTFKRPTNTIDSQKISPVTPDVRLLKRKTSPNEHSEKENSKNTSRIDILSFANNKKNASDLKSYSANNPTTYTFKKLKKD